MLPLTFLPDERLRGAGACPHSHSARPVESRPSPAVEGLYGNVPCRPTEPPGAPQARLPRLHGLLQPGTPVFLASGKTRPVSRRPHTARHFRLLLANGSGAPGGRAGRPRSESRVRGAGGECRGGAVLRCLGSSAEGRNGWEAHSAATAREAVELGYQ